MSGYRPLRSGISESEKGAASGVATLDSGSLLAEGIPSSMLVSAPRTDAYWVPGGDVETGLVYTNESITFLPVPVTRSVDLDRIGVYVGVAGETGCEIGLAVYSLDPTTPSVSLEFDAGTVAADSTGFKEITISETLAPGMYALATLSLGAPTTRPQVLRLTTRSGYPFSRWFLDSGATFQYIAMTSSGHTSFPASPTVSTSLTSTHPVVYLRMG